PTPAFSPPLFELVDLAGHTDEDLPPRLPVRVETRSLPALPQGPHLRRVDLPVRARSPRDLAQVRVQLSDRRAAPVPVPVVDLVDLQPGLQHEGVRDHGLVVRIRVLLDAEVPCNDPIPVVEERPIRADPEPEVVERDEVAIRGNGYEPREAYGALLREGDELVELLPVLGAVDAPVEGEHHRVVALEERELPRRVRVVGEFEVRECRAGDDVFSHGVVLVDGGWFVGVEHVSGPLPTPASGGSPSLVPGRATGTPGAGRGRGPPSPGLRRCPVHSAMEGAAELPARADVQLREHLVQVVLDGLGADEELAPDLRVRVPLGGEAGDLRLLRGEDVAGLGRASGDRLAGGPALPPGALGDGPSP